MSGLPTIHDVAREASVSTTTVSKVINGTKRFSAEVETRVHAAVAKLGFQPNPHARGMTTGRSNTIGVMILDIANPYFASVVKGATREASAHGYNVLLADAEENPERERQLLDTLALRCDGVVLAGSRLGDDTLRGFAQGKPLVAIGRQPGAEVVSVVSDEYEVAFQLTRHLITTGRTRIAYLAGPPFWVNAERQRGYRAALAEAELPTLEWSLSEPTTEGGLELAGTLLLGPERPEAVIAYNDLAALGLLQAAPPLGVRVPQDVAVAGFGDIPFAAQANPPLTTAAAPSLELGRRAVELLLGRLAQAALPTAPSVVRSKLVVRESTRPRSQET